MSTDALNFNTPVLIGEIPLDVDWDYRLFEECCGSKGGSVGGKEIEENIERILVGQGGK